MSSSDKDSCLSVAVANLRSTPLGQSLIARSEASAATYMFDLQGDKNAEVLAVLNPNEIYQAVSLSSSLHINVDGDKYSLVPYTQNIHLMDEDLALDELHSVQSSIEMALLEAFAEYGITG